MRALAITGMVTAALIPSTIEGSDMRATPPAEPMSAGTRSSAMTAAAPADSATRAWSGVTTSMITPPLSISARPVLTRCVATSGITQDGSRDPARDRRALLEPKRLDAVGVGRLVARVHAVGERLHER